MSRKKNPSSHNRSHNRSRTYDLSMASSDARKDSKEPARPLELGSCEKHPAYCQDLNLNLKNILSNLKCFDVRYDLKVCRLPCSLASARRLFQRTDPLY